MEKIEITSCKNCGREVKYNPSPRINSTIKPKPPELCQRCKNMKLLAQSDLVKRDGKTRSKPGQYTIRKINARKLNKKGSKQRARKRADDWFSRFIRIKHAILIAAGEPLCYCYTCGARKFSKNIDNGHWQRRGYTATRYDPNNARPQCRQCNYYRSGMPEVFEEKLKAEIGEIEVEKIRRNARASFHDNAEFYSEQAEKYKRLTNELIKEKQIKKWW